MLDFFVLLWIGFIVGLSGAVMPGPLLVYIIRESLERGKWTGFIVALGHAAVEVVVFLLLACGLLEFYSESLLTLSGLAGGLFLIGMGLAGLRRDREVLFGERERGSELKKRSVFFGGVFFTVFNPGFPVWWMVVGSSLLLEGFRAMGLQGMVTVLAGHWIADAGWFFLVSLTTSRGKELLFSGVGYRRIRTVLSVILMVIGIYFLAGPLAKVF